MCERRQPAAERAGEGMVEHGGEQDAGDDRHGPAETRREQESEQLGFVAELGEGHQASGDEESFHCEFRGRLGRMTTTHPRPSGGVVVKGLAKLKKPPAPWP